VFEKGIVLRFQIIRLHRLLLRFLCPSLPRWLILARFNIVPSRIPLESLGWQHGGELGPGCNSIITVLSGRRIINNQNRYLYYVAFLAGFRVHHLLFSGHSWGIKMGGRRERCIWSFFQTLGTVSQAFLVLTLHNIVHRSVVPKVLIAVQE
jgi:hypothetical protein